MKTTLHYIIAILLFSLNATHAFAEGEKEPFKITKDGGITCVYNEDQTLLSIGGTGSITITGDRKPVKCGIVVKDNTPVKLTIKDLHIKAEAPLTVKTNSGADASAVTNIILEGTNILESNAADSQPGMLIDWSTSISGSGSLTVKGSSSGGAGIGFGEFYENSTPMIIQDNIVVVAIGDKGAEAISGGILNHEGGLLIQGKVDDYGTIEHTSSALAGNLTLGTNFEIPSWATVTIPAGQSITVPEGITLTNKGTLKTQKGTLTNNGSIVNEGTLETKNGTLVNDGTIKANDIITSSKLLNIGGEDGFDVSTNDDGATFSYDGKTQLLTINRISGTGNVLLKGKNKDKAVDCGIVIEGGGLDLTIKNLNIRADNALTFEGVYPTTDYYPILQGTNRLESTKGSGINLKGNKLVIQGPGSLTVIGGNAAYGIQGKVDIYNNACVVAIGGTGGINPDEYDNGLLISGTKQADGSITKDYSELKGNITLRGNLEIPEWAEVTIATGQTFTIAPDVTLTNKGTIKNEGTIKNQGTLSFGVSGKLNGSLEQIKNEGRGEMVCDVSIMLFGGMLGQQLIGINNLNLYNPQKVEYALTPNGNTNTYDISSLPVISDGYELRVGNYPVGQKITTPSEDWMRNVYVIRLYFYIGTDKVDVIRVKDQPVPPYEPEAPMPGHTLKWYEDDVYTTPMTNDDWENTENALSGKSIYGRWEANPDPVDPDPVEPEPPYIPPVPVYYSVYLPQVEGATTDPGPGEYEVESWDNFRFYLTIDSAYSESQPVVTTDRGETLKPRSSDGAYLINDVCSDVEVFIDGLIQNPPPVANEAIGTDALVPQIWAEGSMLCIRMAEALPSAPVRIFTVDGRLYDSFDSTPGLNRRQLPTGIYIVRIGATARKVIIK